MLAYIYPNFWLPHWKFSATPMKLATGASSNFLYSGIIYVYTNRMFQSMDIMSSMSSKTYDSALFLWAPQLYMQLMYELISCISWRHINFKCPKLNSFFLRHFCSCISCFSKLYHDLTNNQVKNTSHSMIRILPSPSPFLTSSHFTLELLIFFWASQLLALLRTSSSGL